MMRRSTLSLFVAAASLTLVGCAGDSPEKTVPQVNENGVLLVSSKLLLSMGDASMDVPPPRTFGAIEDQDGIAAIDEEPSCDDVVMIF